MGWIDKIFSSRAKAPKTAADVAALIAGMEADRQRLEQHIAQQTARKAELLVEGDLQAIEAAEAEIEAAARQIDVTEARLPLLRSRHAELLAAEHAGQAESARAEYAAALGDLAETITATLAKAEAVAALRSRLEGECPVPALANAPGPFIGRLNAEVVGGWTRDIAAWLSPSPAPTRPDLVRCRMLRSAKLAGGGFVAGEAIGLTPAEAAHAIVTGAVALEDPADAYRLPQIRIAAINPTTVAGHALRAGESLTAPAVELAGAVPPSYGISFLRIEVLQ